MRSYPKAVAAKKKAILGKRIVKAEANCCYQDNGDYKQKVHSWVLTLEDGTKLSFDAEENPDGDGVDLIVSKPA
jgi:hypothetical protein